MKNTRSGFRFWRLELPILVVTVALFTSAKWKPFPDTAYDDLILNMAIESLSLLVTVLFVDYTIRAYDKHRWKATDAVIKEEISDLTITAVDRLRWAIGKPIADSKLFTDLLRRDEKGILITNISNLEENSLAKLNSDLAMELTEEVVVCQVKEMNPDSWRQLIRDISATSQDINDLLSRHSIRLEPHDYEYLMNIRKSIKSIQSVYRAVGGWRVDHDLILLPSPNDSPSDLGRKTLDEITSSALLNIFAICSLQLKGGETTTSAPKKPSQTPSCPDTTAITPSARTD